MKPCPVCGLMTDKDPCPRCGHVGGDILEETAAIIDAAMLVEETTMFLAYGDVEGSIAEIRRAHDDHGRLARFSLEALQTIYRRLQGRRADPLDEDPE